jgi:IS605 OrfB family transposase
MIRSQGHGPSSRPARRIFERLRDDEGALKREVRWKLAALIAREAAKRRGGHSPRGAWEESARHMIEHVKDPQLKHRTYQAAFRGVQRAIEGKAQEYGIRVYEVVEYNTSNHCAIHGVEVTRGPRGVVTCPLGHKLHSDLNGALNILRRGVGAIPATLEWPLSFLVDHSGVAPLKGRSRRDPPRDLGEAPP